jgi:hypothetical protein
MTFGQGCYAVISRADVYLCVTASFRRPADKSALFGSKSQHRSGLRNSTTTLLQVAALKTWMFSVLV